MTDPLVETAPMIRLARLEDAAELSALAFRSKAHWGSDAAFMEACRDDLTVLPDDIRTCPVYVLAAGPQPIGFYQLRAHDGEEVELTDLFVEPAFIGQGHGRRLWEHAVATARQPGFHRLVFQSEPHAEAFYRAMGAQRIGESASTVFPGRMLPLMDFALE